MTENKRTFDTQTEELEIDLMEILRKIIAIRKTLYKAAVIGLILGIIVSFSIPKQFTVNVTLSPEMGNSKGEWSSRISDLLFGDKDYND